MTSYQDTDEGFIITMTFLNVFTFDFFLKKTRTKGPKETSPSIKVLTTKIYFQYSLVKNIVLML